MGSEPTEEQRELARLRELAEIEMLLSLVENKTSEATQYLEEVLARMDDLSW